MKKLIEKIGSKNRSQKRLADLVGIDFSTTATKVVRLKQNKSETTLAGMDLLPAVDFSQTSKRIELPRNMSSNYGCIAYSGPAAVTRMVNAPLSGSEALPEKKIRELLNVTDDFRVSARLIQQGKGRRDSSFLAAAIPKDDVKYLLNMFPAGPPAPASIEVAGLSFVSAFVHALPEEAANKAVCLVDAGESMTHFVFMNKGEVVLVGKMPFGGKTLRNKLSNDLGVDEEIAQSILSDRSINISSSLSGSMAPLTKQISISRDFIERHQGFRVSGVYLSGGLCMLPSWAQEVSGQLQVEASTWNPLANIQYDEESISAEMVQQASRFTAAIGAAIGGLSE
jgi:Tfp pilus assembly PilM family ATPase